MSWYETVSLVTTARNGATVHPWYLDTYRAVAEDEQGNVENLSVNLSTLNPVQNALKFNPSLFYEKTGTNGTKYSKVIVTPAVEMWHKHSKIMI